MMKAAILSINLHTRKLNYGAVLHSWVFQRLIGARDDVETCDVIDYLPAALEGVDLKRQFREKASLRHPGDCLRRWRQTAAFARRDRAVEQFFREHMRVTPEHYTAASIQTARLPYDAVFFKSDVIWSPTYFRGDFDPVFFGAVDSMAGIRRIVYAASMGQARLDAAQRERLRALLRWPDHISLRERYAAELVRGLTDKPVADVLDPTLLAEPGDFDAIAAPGRVGGGYLLVYFPTHVDAALLEVAAAQARAKGFQLVEVSNYFAPGPKRRVIADAGIGEFLGLVRGAEAVYCNSLHGVCLSILFHRDFYAFDREGGGDKYRDLCRRFGLEDRFMEQGSFREAAPVDWARVDALRQSKKRRSLQWLDAAIAQG
ncbi:MAG: polysaccharide pyruvyl transferase family protein [Clostridia bacterium]|nr:polysaccharide pyruvyl transferase family protein [Clostridia bacterium]